MRKLGEFPEIGSAERLATALRNRDIPTVARSESDGRVSLWILNEDQMATARDELARFEASPDDERYRSTPRPDASPQDVEPTQPTRRGPAWQRAPVTFLFIGISVLVTAVTLLSEPFGWDETGLRVRSDLSIVGFEIEDDKAFWYPALGLHDVRTGELWRLVTPIFPHGDPLHLLFNMAWLWLLGGAVESMRGSWRLLCLVLVTAVASNLAEYYFNFGFTFNQQDGLRSETGYAPDPFFLGMSGVVFGLFGYIWMRSRLLAESGFAMPRDLVVWMLIWLVVCASGLVGPIANVAHGVGLLVGMTFGALPRLWRRS